MSYPIIKFNLDSPAVYGLTPKDESILHNIANGPIASLSESKQASLANLANISNLSTAAALASIGTSDVLATQAFVTAAINNIAGSLNNSSSVVNAALGGSGTTLARVNSINTALLQNPTGVVSSDLATARSKLVTTPGASFEHDIQTLNTSVDGTATGSTLQNRISSLNLFFLTSPTNTLITDLATARSLFITTPGATLQSDAQTLNLILNGTSSGSTTQARITSLNASLLQSPTNVVSTDLATARSLFVTSLGSTLQADSQTLNSHIDGTSAGSTTQARITSLNTSLLTNPTGVLSADLLSARSLLVTSLGSTLEADTHTLNSALNGTASGSTTQARITSINNVLLSSPTGVLSTDLTTGRNLLVTTPGSSLQSDSQTLNSLLNGTSTGSTTQARISSLNASLLTSPTSVVSTDLSSARSLLVTSLGSTLQADIQTVNTIIDGAGTGSTTQTKITNLATIIGGSSNLYSRLNTINSTLDGVQSLSGLTSFTVTTTAANFSGSISIIGNDGSSGRSYSVDTSGSGINIGNGTGGTTSISNGATFILTNSSSGNTIQFINNSGSSITSTSSLTTYLASTYPVNSVIKANTNTKATALKNLLGGSGNNAMTNTINIDNSLLINPTGVINTDLSTARNLLVSMIGSNLESDIQTLNLAIDGTSTGSTVQTRIGTPMLGGGASSLNNIIGGTSTDIATQLGDPGFSTTIINNIGGSTTSIQSSLNALSTLLFNNTSFSSSLYNQITSTSITIDNGLSSLPDGATYATVSNGAASDGFGGVNIHFTAGSASGTYNLSATTITNSIGNNSTFTMTNGSNVISLINRSGSTISTQTRAITYLASMYPSSSQLAIGISDKLSNGLAKMVGGSATSVRAKIAAVDSILLTNPTGVLASDITTLRQLILTNLDTTMQADIAQISSYFGSSSSLTNNTTLYNILTDPNNINQSGLLSKINATQPISVINGLDSLATIFDGSSSGSLTGAAGTEGNLVDKINGVLTKINNVGTSAYVIGSGGSDLTFINYTGSTSYLFNGNEISVNSSTISINLGSIAYTYTTSSANISTGSILTFVSSSDLQIVLTTNTDYNNGNANANANDLQGALISFFQPGACLYAGNLSSKIESVQQLVDGGTTNLTDSLTNIATTLDGTFGFVLNGTTGANFIVPAYNGATSQIFGSNAFSNGGTTIISVMIGSDTYVYDNTGVTSIGGYSSISFSSNRTKLVVNNNTGNPMTASTDQLLTNTIVSALNAYFTNGSCIKAGNLVSKIGLPTINSTSSNLSTVIGGNGIDIASRLGDPVGGNIGLSSLINASNASNPNNIWNDLSNFQNSLSIYDQINAFLALFSTNNISNSNATTITKPLSRKPQNLFWG